MADAMTDMTWDGNLIWGAGERIIYGFDTTGHVERQFVGPFANNKAIAWDPVHEFLWVTAPQSAIYGLDRDGRAFEALRSPNLRVTGLAFWPDDPDGYQLYLLTNPHDDSTLIYKINVQTDSVRFVCQLTPQAGGIPGGLEITPDYAGYDWSLMMLMDDPSNNNGGDRVDLYQLGIITGWLNLDQLAGTIPAGGAFDATLTLNTADLDPGAYLGRFEYLHNARGSRAVLNVRLDVSGQAAPTDPELKLPTDYRIASVWPSPFNSSFKVAYELPASGMTELEVYDLSGREISRLLSHFELAGYHSLSVNASSWGSGVYLLRMRSGSATRIAKVVEVK